MSPSISKFQFFFCDYVSKNYIYVLDFFPKFFISIPSSRSHCSDNILEIIDVQCALKWSQCVSPQLSPLFSVLIILMNDTTVQIRNLEFWHKSCSFIVITFQSPSPRILLPVVPWLCLLLSTATNTLLQPTIISFFNYYDNLLMDILPVYSLI